MRKTNKKTIWHMFRYFRMKKYLKHREKFPLCYSEGGFLVDLLEQNGFCVTKLDYKGNSYSMEVKLAVDEKDFQARLRRIARRHYIIT